METNNINNTYGDGFSTEPGYMDPPQLTPAGVQAEIKKTRHKKEVPLYVFLIIVGLIACTVLVLRDVQGDGLLVEIREFLSDLPDLSSRDPESIMQLAIVIMSLVFGTGAIIILVVMSLYQMYRTYADQMSYSIRVSEKNYPEIYQKVREYTWLLGWKKEPEVYVQQMNGSLNAFTCWVPGKVFIQLNAEIVDIAYMEHKDFDTIFFVMAHEFGHAYLHHVQLYYSFWSMLASFIPFLGSNILLPMLSRSREYSADRVAQALTGGVAQEDCMMLLGAGRHSYKYVDTQSYISEIMAHYNVVERFFRWLVNLLASHPIMPYRVQAILDPYKRSGRLL